MDEGVLGPDPEHHLTETLPIACQWGLSILVCFGVAGIEIMRVVRSIPLVLLICEPHGIPTSIVMLFVIEYVASFVTAYGPTGLVMVRGNLQREKRRAVNRRLEEADG